MSAFMMSEQMLMQSQHYNSGYHQQLLMTAAMCNYQDPQASLPSTPPELLECEMELLNADMWKQFHALGTEMIITKNGRRMFPSLSVQVRGLRAGEQYAVAVEMWPAGGARWRRAGGVWAAGGPGAQGPAAPHGAALHPDGPAPASRWSQPVNFNRMKLTNNVHDSSGNIVLTSMCKYQPRIRVMRVGGGWPAEKVFTFPETEFIAVTAYQNEEITQLKINNNPFAKGFRKCGQGKCKRKMRSPSPDTENCCDGPSSPKIRSSVCPNRTTSEPCEITQTHSPTASSFATRKSESPRVEDESPPLDAAHACMTNESGVSRLMCDESQFIEGSSSSVRSSIRSPLRSPSASSESSCHFSVSSRFEDPVPQQLHQQFGDMRYFQLAEWAHYLLYSNPLWIPPTLPGFGAHLPSMPRLWHLPSPPPLPSPSVQQMPPTAACRPRDQPKGSSFTIRALIGEN